MSDLAVQDKIHHGGHFRSEKVRRDTSGFSDLIKQAVNRVNDMKIEADQSVEQLAKGEVGIHETMIAMQKADISMRLLLQVRSKVMDAYREVMRMPF